MLDVSIPDAIPFEVTSLLLEVQPAISSDSAAISKPSPYQASSCGPDGILMLDIAISPDNIAMCMFNGPHPPAHSPTFASGSEESHSKSLIDYYGSDTFIVSSSVDHFPSNKVHLCCGLLTSL